MNEFFAERKKEILRYLEELVEEKSRDLSRVHPTGKDVAERILDFAGRGKMLRGGLVALGYALYVDGGVAGRAGEASAARRSFPREVTALGAAMELFQSAFLMHDDIMDRDRQRRGVKTVFAQYVDEARAEGIPDAEHMGESLGICAGDIAFFLAYEILGRIGETVDPSATAGALSGTSCAPLFTLASRELSYVGVAQMLDVRWGNGLDEVAENDVLDLYRYKTGRYTFSLPLSAGALLAGADKSGREKLEEIGEDLGVVFQLRDDELGLYGDEEAIGKPIGSDIREGKKTPFFLALMDRVDEEGRTRLFSIFGNEEASEKDVTHIRSLVEELGIRGEMIQKCRDISDAAQQKIAALDGENSSARRILEELLDYGLNRTS